MKIITTIDDLKPLYKRRVPKMFYDYTIGGSWTEQTLRENISDFNKLYFRQRVAVDISNRTTKTKLIGQDATMPVALAPVGLTGLQHPDGEIKAAKAAEEFGVPFTLSTMSICSIEDVAKNTSKPFWFQLYCMSDRPFIENLIDRAKEAKCSALIITLDLQILGQRHKDIKNQMTAPPKLTLKNIMNMATKPKWCLGMMGTKRHGFANIVGHASGVKNLTSLSEWSANNLLRTLNWDDLDWMIKRWGGKVILKGIQDVEDAKMAVKTGADAIVVSNHGGRQLDGALSSIRSLPSIIDAVGGKIEVWVDGGIRSGQDVAKAVSLGAKGVMIGRPFIYGLGAMGQGGVTKALEIIQKELDTTIALCGEQSVENMSRKNLLIPKDFRGNWE
ncbi:alpha-hydroxy-acid oxidizing protein [Amylibacter sp.]|jgi:L-lactate dehydrogenase (cytochrome)|nr:alpha-hydroxy-acid oxidizing protein [Amylibacter sp.]MDB0059318.1 alpha-hydroxy-acid oxidizing protein [bacterium]MDA8853572.1 alpha-hydroxy-acid oxidizing protein [Amylibacter sp.]MDA8913496.1 alpha-hydroxy-acid oxidizing protein [Amylibacter sp.]MDA9074889.1 alpha-hydroxy-acid oxidizing protein [Amylibacter sp.]|tara:strand:+ start:2144 stop:3307 length:1164 start_codon:yes stop_codon:yes gene_type:complete